MTEHLKYLLKHVSDFDDTQLNRIIECFRQKTLRRNSILVAAGDVCKEFYYVDKGCIRTYFINQKGQEKTRLIISDCSIGTALASFIYQKPSFEFVDALEDTELLAISHADFYRLIDEMPQWQTFYQKMLEMAYTFQNKKITSLVTLSAKERFDELLRESPDLMLRVPNRVLASYLDMTQETLSRLKSK